MPPRCIIPLCFLFVTGCFTLTASQGGGQNVTFSGNRPVNAADVAVPPGYEITAVATGLNFPTGVCFDDHGGVYVTESDDRGRGALVRLNSNGLTNVVATAEGSAFSGACFDKGAFYVAQAGGVGAPHGAGGGAILKITPDGQITPLIQNLPSMGEYHTNAPIVGSDGYVYFGQGSATNSGVIGEDDQKLGWVDFARGFHDIPPADTALAGQNFQTADSLSPGGAKITGAFSPDGQPSAPGQVIPGQIPATGAIMRVPVAGGPAELVAWGFRNPTGLAFDSAGQLYATEQSYEARGSRPVSGCGDLLWAVQSGRWYGWPDFYGDIPLTSFPRQFAAVAQPPPQALLASHTSVPPTPAAIFAMHAGASGLDFCRNGDFGHADELFIAEFGDLAPFDGKLLAPTGFDVLRVDPETGVSHVFAANRGAVNGPASKLGAGGLERPIAARFDPSGLNLYVVDYGVVTVGDIPQPQAHTGVLWKISLRGTP